MAAGTDAPDDKQGPNQDGPSRPKEVRQSIAWPDSASMPAQNNAANQTFKQNSERMQQAAEAKRDAMGKDSIAPQRTLNFNKDRSRGNYAELKKDQPADQGKDQTKGQETGERKLTFAKDGPGKTQEKETQDQSTKDQAKAAGKELTFRKDQGHDQSRGR